MFGPAHQHLGVRGEASAGSLHHPHGLSATWPSARRPGKPAPTVGRAAEPHPKDGTVRGLPQPGASRRSAAGQWGRVLSVTSANRVFTSVHLKSRPPTSLKQDSAGTEFTPAVLPRAGGKRWPSAASCGVVSCPWLTRCSLCLGRRGHGMAQGRHRRAHRWCLGPRTGATAGEETHS